MLKEEEMPRAAASSKEESEDKFENIANIKKALFTNVERAFYLSCIVTGDL